jgi:hypothetical protein
MQGGRPVMIRRNSSVPILNWCVVGRSKHWAAVIAASRRSGRPLVASDQQESVCLAQCARRERQVRDELDARFTKYGPLARSAAGHGASELGRGRLSEAQSATVAVVKLLALP